MHLNAALPLSHFAVLAVLLSSGSLLWQRNAGPNTFLISFLSIGCLFSTTAGSLSAVVQRGPKLSGVISHDIISVLLESQVGYDSLVFTARVLALRAQ